jgi:hypothetical protein
MPRKRKPPPHLPEDAPSYRHRAVALEQLTPKHAAFVAQLTLQGGENVRKAAESVGLDYDYARQLLVRNPAIRDAVDAARATVTSELRDWAELAAKAQQTVEDLLTSDSDKVRLGAAIHILDRAEGKPRQKVDVKVEESDAGPDTPSMRWALLALFNGRFASLAEAVHHATQHPEQVREWATNAQRGEVAP